MRIGERSEAGCRNLLASYPHGGFHTLNPIVREFARQSWSDPSRFREYDLSKMDEEWRL
jgi:hypothetical protein